MQTYGAQARICTLFYDLNNNPDDIASFIESKTGPLGGKRVLFIGGFFSVAKIFSDKGIAITISDYTDEMVAEGKKRLPACRLVKADVRELPFQHEFDIILLVGRVFTHMFDDADANKALLSMKKSLKPGGLLLFDNYEDSKIGKTNYFNGEINVSGPGISIRRISSTQLISKKPFVVNWKAQYIVMENGYPGVGLHPGVGTGLERLRQQRR